VKNAPLGPGRAPRPAIVEGGEAVALGESVERWLPGLGGIAEPGDDQHVGALATALDPELGPVGIDHLPRLQLLDRRCPQPLGSMLAFRRNRFPGSYFALISARRS
jgi:hypothetical protein